MSDGTHICACTSKSASSIDVYGPAASIAEIGEQLAWLGATLRCSPREEGLAYCTPFIVRPLSGNTGEQSFNLPSSADISYVIKFITEDTPQRVSPERSNGQCWHDMFKNSIVTKGYPIPRRTSCNIGLEIPLNVMAGLARTRRIDHFNKKIFLKGFSTMLFPTERSMDTLYWHLIYKKDGGRISYLDSPPSHDQSIGDLELENFRHVVGWCSEAKLYAGKD